MKDYIKIRILQAALLSYSIFGLIQFDIVYIILGLLTYAFLETIGGNIGLHRYFCHKSFSTNTINHNILTFFSHYIAVGSVASWVGQHRWHHEHADTELDQHSPYTNNILKIFFGIWEMNISRKYVKDIIKNSQLMWYHRNYWSLHIGIIIFWSLIGFDFLFCFYALPALMCLVSGYILATVTHYHGYKTHPIKDHSTNSWLANIYTLGEGWHNNHHAFPNRLRQGERWWEWDLPAFIIERFLAK
jgi:stearoyl-CoA desaturase (delta-9 desaturase)